MVAVPTHFFKVVLAEGDQEAALGAFVLPNAPVQPDTPLTAFSVPVESLEEAAGGIMNVLDAQSVLLWLLPVAS